MSKATGLAAFTRKGKGVITTQEPITIEPPAVRKRGRGKGDIVALTVRLPRAEWERVHQLAVAEGVSIQALAVKGLSRVFLEKGLPGLEN